MADIEITMNVDWRDELGRFANQIDEGAEQGVSEATDVGVGTARAMAPKRTGRLAGAIHKIGGGLRQGFEAGHEVYMIAQDQGGAAHLIGEDGQFLTDRGDFAAKGPVLHPGNPATHYMRKGFQAARAVVTALVQEHMP